MRILQFCHKIPYPIRDGGAFSLYHTALGLISMGIDVKVLAINTPKNRVDITCISNEYMNKTRFEFSLVDTRLNLFNALFNLFTSHSYFVERFYSGQLNADLIRIIRNDEFDIIQLEHVYLCVYLATIRRYSQAKVILRPQNIENKIWKRFLKSEINPFKKEYLRIAISRLEKFETEMAKRVDGIIAISYPDVDLLKTYAPGTPIVNVPIGINFDQIRTYDFSRQFVNFPVFYHLGSMDWLPNIQGIKWFIEMVMPEILTVYPEFIFRIAGKKMPRCLFKLQSKNLFVDGEVIDSEKYHEDKAIMVVPLLAGGGLRAKIIEGMALGKTIISTSIGAEGIPYMDQKNILIADTIEDFVGQIQKCANSKELCSEIGRNARILAMEHFSYQKTAFEMVSFYHRFKS